jgi:hypothetical protein
MGTHSWDYERPEPLIWSREELIAEIDKGARERRGISGRRLVRAWRTGRLRESGEVADILALAFLLGKDDPFVLPPPRRQRAVR